VRFIVHVVCTERATVVCPDEKGPPGRKVVRAFLADRFPDRFPKPTP
jgi:hypothetical protein